MLNNIEAVIFDMDGSLVDSMWLWSEVDKIYIEKYNLKLPEDFHKDIEGMSYTETAQYFVDKCPNLPCTVDEVKAEWTSLTKEIYQSRVPLKTGAKQFLQYARQHEILMGIATSNSRELVDTTVKALGIEDYFGYICTACDVQKGKPAPDVYLKVAEELGVQTERCLVFEDVPNGIRAGKNAGMRVCAVDDAFSKPYEAEKRELADYYINNYFEILTQFYK